MQRKYEVPKPGDIVFFVNTRGDRIPAILLKVEERTWRVDLTKFMAHGQATKVDVPFAETGSWNPKEHPDTWHFR